MPETSEQTIRVKDSPLQFAVQEVLFLIGIRTFGLDEACTLSAMMMPIYTYTLLTPTRCPLRPTSI